MMKKITKVEHAESAFMNKGKSGNWKKHLTPAMEKRIEDWEAKWLEGSDLKFVYEV